MNEQVIEQFTLLTQVYQQATISGEHLWFSAFHICKALEIQDMEQALGLVRKYQLNSVVELRDGTDTPYVSEAGLQKLVSMSDTTQAQMFSEWMRNNEPEPAYEAKASLLPVLRSIERFLDEEDLAELGMNILRWGIRSRHQAA